MFEVTYTRNAHLKDVRLKWKELGLAMPSLLSMLICSAQYAAALLRAE